MTIDSLLRYYSHAYYRNGFRRCDAASSDPNRLTFETGFYGVEFDIDDLTKIWFQVLEDQVAYQDCLTTNRTDSLEEGVMNIQIKQGDVTYTCKKIAPARDKLKPFNGNVILWEAGKVSQRFELLQLIFTDEDEKVLDGTYSLTIQVWPDTFALTLTAKDLTAETELEVTLQANDWVIEQCYSQESFNVTLHCNIQERTSDATLKVTTDVEPDPDPTIEQGLLKTQYNDAMHAYETTVDYWYSAKEGFSVRKFKVAYTDIREYDDYELVLEEGTTSPTPYVLSMGMPANVTGMVPMLLTEDGIPSGLPVQVSKNWHWQEKGSYAKLYMMLPASGKYILRVAYGFYGTLPSASHAQLSLWGYGTNSPSGRWDQLAIGCWGETLCIDSEFSCVEEKITDVRGLMMGSEPAQKWNWTHCAWGGDWIRVYASNKRLYVNNMKVAYLAHGPCLTHVRFHGYYGDGAIEFQVGIRTLRTDDYCRTFFQFDYQVLKDISLENGYLHSMLQRCFHTPTVAHGNWGGLSEERPIPDGLEANEVYVENQSFTGAAPFWIAFPDSTQFPPNEEGKKQMPDGTKNLIIQAFEANVGGTCYKEPAFSLVNEKSNWTRQQGESPSLMANLELPNGIKDLQAGDSIKMETEWTTHSREARDYNGPNSNYKEFLSLNPNSWKIPFREAQLNGSLLTVRVDEEGGDLVHKYPITVNVTNEEGVKLYIDGGVGGMPMEFCGLMHTDYRLYQANKETGEDTMLDQSSDVGNDYWQTDYNFSTSTYTMTFNPMLGDVWSTTWRLKSIRND